MKTEENKQKRELSDEELKQVTGGINVDCILPENKDKFQCSDKAIHAILAGATSCPEGIDIPNCKQ